MSVQFPADSAPLWSVAPALGIDLAQAITTDRLTPADLSQMLRDCGTCWNRRKCRDWRAGAGGPMPAFCPGSARLNALAG